MMDQSENDLAPSPSPLNGFHQRNLLTYLSLLSSCLALFLASKTNSSLGIVNILLCLSILADCFDGKFARLFHRTSKLQQEIGGQLDSFADFFAFGALPAFMLLWHFESHPFFWTAILISGFYLLCVMHRLAFFNVASADTDGFVGLPSPLGALGVAFVWSLDPDLKELLLAYILMAAWMVSPHSIKRPKLKGKLFILGLIAMTIALHLKNL